MGQALVPEAHDEGLPVVTELADVLIAATGCTEEDARSALAAIRDALSVDPTLALDLGFSMGGELYRKGGFVRAFYIAKEET